MTITTVFMLLVFAMIIAAGSYAGYQMLGSGKVSTTNQQIAQITASVDGAFAQQASYAGLTNSLAITQKLVPGNMVSGNNIVNAYGGTVTLQPDPNITNGFDLIESGLGNASCAAIAEDTTAYEIEINGTLAASNTPVAPAVAGQDCTAGPGANTVTFVNTQNNG
jgi:hypothetical protein